jgi:hypothetical protein
MVKGELRENTQEDFDTKESNKKLPFGVVVLFGAFSPFVNFMSGTEFNGIAFIPVIGGLGIIMLNYWIAYQFWLKCPWRTDNLKNRFFILLISVVAPLFSYLSGIGFQKSFFIELPVIIFLFLCGINILFFNGLQSD